MVFGRSQRQETGFVIAGYVLAKEQRGLTSDYKRFPLPSSPAKGRRRSCLGPKPETRKRKSPENHLWPRPVGRHERRTAISKGKSLVFRGPEVCFLGSKENSPSGEEEENLCAEPSLEHVFFFFSLDGLVTLWLSRARVCLEAVTKPRDRDEISFVESRPETVSLDGQRIDKDYEIRFAVKENWLWVFLVSRCIF
jgi:hypothetical protein